MTNTDPHQEQEQNTIKLVMNAFDKVAKEDGATAEEIARYLQDKFGDVWKVSTLVGKAEETLKRSAALGFLDKRGDRYMKILARELRCGRRRRRRRSCRRRRRRSCGRKRRRRRSRRRGRRRRPCCCKK